MKFETTFDKFFDCFYVGSFGAVKYSINCIKSFV